MDRLKKVFNLSAVHQKTKIDVKIREAVSAGNLKNLKKLAKQNASQRDTFNRIALLDACAHGKDEVLQFLVETKADLNVWDKQQQSALMKAVQAQSERCVSILLDNHADTKLVDIDGNTALHFAASNVSISIAQLLVENMAGVYTPNKVRDTPLSLAVTNNNCEMVRFLVTKGADVNFKGQQQRSPLMVAAFYGFYEMCGLLLESGADVTLTDDNGWPANVCADMNKHHSCSALIFSYSTRKNAAPAQKHQEPEATAVKEELLSSCTVEESLFGQLDSDTDDIKANDSEAFNGDLKFLADWLSSEQDDDDDEAALDQKNPQQEVACPKSGEGLSTSSGTTVLSSPSPHAKASFLFGGPATDKPAQPDQEPSVSVVQETLCDQTNGSSEVVQLLQGLKPADDEEDENQDWSDWDSSSVSSTNSERGHAEESVQLELPITPAQPDQEPSVSVVQETLCDQTNGSSEVVQLLQGLKPADEEEDENQDWSDWDSSSVSSTNRERGHAEESVQLELTITPDVRNMVMLQNIEPDDESCHPADQEEFQAEVTDFQFPLKEEEDRFCLTARKGDVTREEELRKAEEQQQSKTGEDHSDTQRLLAEEHHAQTLQENQLQSQLPQPQEAEDHNMLDFSKSSEASSQLHETCDREKELLQLSASLLKEELQFLKADFECSQASSCFRERCLVEENKALKKQLETTGAELKEERQAQKKLESCRTRLTEILQEVEECMSAQAGREESLLREIDEYRRLTGTLTAEAASRREAVSSLSQKLTTAESHAASMEKELHRVTLQLSQKDLLLEVLQRDKDQAAASAKELEEALQAERERVSHAAARQEAAEEQLAKAQSEARLLQKQLEEAESKTREGQKIAELQFEPEKEVSRCTRPQNENKELQHKLASLKSLSQSTDQLEIRHRKLEEEVLVLKHKVGASRKENSLSAQYCRDLKEKARRTLQQKQAQVARLQSQAVSQQGLNAHHSASEQNLRLQFAQKARELEHLQVWAYNHQQDLLQQTNSAHAEIQRLRQLHTGEMAQALLARRIWTLSTKADRCLPASTASISSSSSPSWSSFSTSVPSWVSSLPPSRTLFRSLPHNVRCEISSNIQNKEDFRNGVISSHLPVLVAFRAQWCGRSRILAARLEKAVAKQEGRVAMAKVDVDESTDLAVEYGVFALPTVIAVRGGDIVARFEGMKDADQLDSFISKLITSSK